MTAVHPREQESDNNDDYWRDKLSSAGAKYLNRRHRNYIQTISTKADSAVTRRKNAAKDECTWKDVRNIHVCASFCCYRYGFALIITIVVVK